MRAWYRQLSDSERWLVSGVAVLAGLMLLYLLLLVPLFDKNRELKEEIASKRSAATWMAGTAVEIRTLAASAEKQHQKDNRTLIARVNSELREKQVIPTRIKPDGESKLSVSVENTLFTNLMERLDLLQRHYGIFVINAVIQPQGGGLVNAQLTLVREN